MEQSEYGTQGKVISRLAYVLDFAENLMFLGRLEQVWQRLIDKAEFSRGERVIDVGCGTGTVPSSRRISSRLAVKFLASTLQPR